MNNKHRDCYKCQYFYVTWDKKFPRGCKALGFKSAQLPSLEVYKTSKMPCLYFKEKTVS
ncbi:MAG: uracil-DNA glycosylase [Clostridia bacterium]|nr:uracil-DNA glycosylase [Clostridia bacterium]